MKRFTRGLALTSLCLSLAACGSARYYTLPVNSERASETQSMIGVCASDMGLESYKAEEFVTVKYDETASLYYRYEGGDTAQLQVLVDDKRVHPQELEQKQVAVKAKADEIYACVQSRLYPPPPPPVAVAPAPAPAPEMQAQVSQTGMSFEMKADMTTGVTVRASTTTTATNTATTTQHVSAKVGMGGTCAQAVECYAQLHKVLCEGASDCSFKAKVSGNDDSACRDALVQAHETVKHLSQFRPGLSTPAVCNVE